MWIGLLLAYLGGCMTGAIIALHSTKMRSMAKSVDDEFKAAQASLEAKWAGKPATADKPETTEPPKP